MQCRTGDRAGQHGGGIADGKRPHSGFWRTGERSEQGRSDAICVARATHIAQASGRLQCAAVAIAFARARYLSRATGGNAVRSAAYNARKAITAERTGELFHFRHREAPEHHEVLLPDGADTRFADAAAL